MSEQGLGFWGLGTSLEAPLKVARRRARRRSWYGALGAGLMLSLVGLSAGGCGDDDAQPNQNPTVTPKCQAGEQRCKSTAVEACNAEGTAFELQEVCSGSAPFCSEGACVACEVSAPFCRGDVVYGRCQQSSEVEVVVRDCAAAGQVCGEGACRDATCEPGSVSCDGNEVVTCAADGQGIAKREACGANRQCFDGRCENWVCRPGMHCKTPSQVEVCSEDGLTVLETTSCSAAQGCEAGECRARICTPSATFCKGSERFVCAPSGAAEEPWPCGERQSCTQGDQCADWICEPGTSTCEGTQPMRCAADGLSWVQQGAECRGSTTCSAGVCEDWLCTPSANYCDGNLPMTCASDGLSSASRRRNECQAPLTCAGGDCCKPRAQFCAGGQVMRCDSDGLSAQSLSTCGGSEPYCLAAACTADYAGYARGPLPGTPGHPFSYTVNEAAKTVLDNVTGLLWQREMPADLPTDVAAAQSYCAGLTWGGRSDWRLPTLMELASLIDYTQQFPAIDSAAFPDVIDRLTWTATGQGQNRWYVSFMLGDVLSYTNLYSYELSVRCVAEAAPQKPIPESGHFFEVTGSTVLDTATGLEWQRGTSPSKQNRADSIGYCAGLTLDGKTGWRLPSAAEMNTLHQGNKVERPFIDLTVFPDTRSGSDSNYWVTTLPFPNNGFTVNYFEGFTLVGGADPMAELWARCVR